MTGTPESNGPGARRRLSAETITAISAVVIGVCAIAVSVYETTLVRQQLKGSVWPYVDLGYGFTEDGFRYLMINNGVGPARVMHGVVRVDGQPVPDWGTFFDRLGIPVERYITSTVSGRALAPNVPFEILSLAGAPAQALFMATERVTLEVCYCSVYEDCWTRTLGLDPVPVRSCAADPNSLFRN